MKRALYILFILLGSTCFAQQAYYNDVDLTKRGLDLRDELADKVIRTHVNLLSYTPGIWEALKIIDTDPKNPDNVLLMYGFEGGNDQDPENDRARNKNQNGGANGDWNREHIYPKSLGKPNLGTEGPGADAHQLRASDVKRNARRANRKYAEGSGNSGNVDAYWYPGDEWKGDVARMLMYMYLHYGERCLPQSVVVGDANSVDPNMINLLLKWNAEDPVSAVEDQRNEYLSGSAKYAQGNRNPFIDDPYLATLIWGGPAAVDRWGIFSAITKDKFMAEAITQSDSLVLVKTPKNIEQITVYDMKGRLVERYKKRSEINTKFYADGIYFLVVSTKNDDVIIDFRVE